MSDTKKIYCYTGTSKEGVTLVLALCEDGHVLAGSKFHDIDTAKINIGMSGKYEDAPDKFDTYSAHCKGPYKLEWVDQDGIENQKEFKDALAKYREVKKEKAITKSKIGTEKVIVIVIIVGVLVALNIATRSLCEISWFYVLFKGICSLQLNSIYY